MQAAWLRTISGISKRKVRQSKYKSNKSVPQRPNPERKARSEVRRVSGQRGVDRIRRQKAETKSRSRAGRDHNEQQSNQTNGTSRRSRLQNYGLGRKSAPGKQYKTAVYWRREQATATLTGQRRKI
ncbi:hypothetical protein DPX16_17315 [Anabarilius grahami]|uniref:Uncharacterized protein n=1 Tax=Anabarilius grahami TaxID=495550 RepID=A0A3N0YBM4_ANAGA|nr:hypothetical protein DPX16_17315 [Anabarilius grahami]